jgi:uncharacterized protein DUF1573
MTLRSHGMAALCLLSFAAPAVRAQLRCEPSVLDFGRRPQNQVFTAQARITNVLPGPVSILSVQPDCGCITADTAVSDLAPGESTTLTVRMQSGGLEGQFQHNVVVATREGPSAVLAVKMAVYRYVNWVVDPARLILPPSSRGTEVAAELHVTHVGAEQLGIASVACDSPYIAIVPGGAAGNIATYKVRKLASAPAGPIYSDVRITTDDPTAAILDVPVFAYVTDDKK